MIANVVMRTFDREQGEIHSASESAWTRSEHNAILLRGESCGRNSCITYTGCAQILFLILDRIVLNSRNNQSCYAIHTPVYPGLWRKRTFLELLFARYEISLPIDRQILSCLRISKDISRTVQKICLKLMCNLSSLCFSFRVRQL